VKRFTAVALIALAALFTSASARAAETAIEVPKIKMNHEAMEKVGFRLAFQAWTFNKLTTFETLDLMQQLGVRYLEIFPGQTLSKDLPGAKTDHNMTDEQIAAFKAKLKSAGVTVVNYGVVGVGKDEKSARPVFEFAKKLGLETIVSEPATDPKVFEMLDKLCQEYGVNLACHDHPKPSPYWDPATVLKLTEGRSKRIGACADTGHWYRSGLVPIDCLKQLKGKIISLHYKDLNKNKGDVPFGEGLGDAKGQLVELKAQGFKGVFSIEFERTSGQELVNNVAKCCENFSKMCEELAADAK